MNTLLIFLMMNTDQDTSNASNKKVEQTSKDSKPNQENLIDDAFYVNEKKYGLWDSTDLDGKGLVTSLTKEQCISATRFYLKGKQEGFSENDSSYSGIVGGKL